MPYEPPQKPVTDEKLRLRFSTAFEHVIEPHPHPAEAPPQYPRLSWDNLVFDPVLKKWKD